MGWARRTIRWAAIVLNLTLGLILGAFVITAWLRAEPSEPVEMSWIFGSVASLFAVVALLLERVKSEQAN